MLPDTAAWGSHATLESIKWLAPLLISALALWNSIRDNRRARLQSSTRARQQYNAELRRWTSDSIATLTEATVTLRQAEPYRARLIDLTARLSALADQGRLFFPNPSLGIRGQSNEEAYRDFRPRILDWLIYAHDILCSASTLPDLEGSETLARMRRGFTSDAQMAIDPQNLFTTMEDLNRLLNTGPFMERSRTHQSLIDAQSLLRRRTAPPTASAPTASMPLPPAG